VRDQSRVGVVVRSEALPANAGRPGGALAVNALAPTPPAPPTN